MIHTIQVLSGVTITSAGTTTSAAFRSEFGRIGGFFYDLADATTGTYVAATARLLVASDSSQTFVLPVDSAGAAMSTLLININSNDRYIGYRYDDLPIAPWSQVQLLSSTDNSLTFRAVYLVYIDD